MKKNTKEENLGKLIIDSNPAYCHGEWISKEEKEKVIIAGPEAYLPGAKSVIVLGMVADTIR